MFKWIGGGCLLIVVLIGVVFFFSYRQMAQEADKGPSVSTMIAATPERVFASLAHSDSLTNWRLAPVRASRKGLLRGGDTIFDAVADSQSQRMFWIVDTVVTNQQVAWRVVIASNGQVAFRRQDSLSVAGDSTRITSTVSTAMSDSAEALRGRGGQVMGTLLGASSKMMIAGMRVQAEAEHRRLKEGIEGRPMVRPDSQ